MGLGGKEKDKRERKINGGMMGAVEWVEVDPVRQWAGGSLATVACQGFGGK